MVRNYKRKKEGVDEYNMKKAVSEIIKEKKSIRGTALKYNLNHNTLYSRIQVAKSVNKNFDNGNDSGQQSDDNITTLKVPDKPKHKHQQVFTTAEEMELEKYLLRSSKIYYGLTYKQTQNLAYGYAKMLKKLYPSSWDQNNEAGKDWILSFMRRHPELSLRKPENTSLARATAFNKTTVQRFFDNYLDVIKRYKFSPNRIYNIDETGITTVLQTPKIISKKSLKQVGQIVSGERGELVTFCGIINAIGNSLPPIYIFPRIRYKETFLAGAPSGSLGFASKTGWMTAEIFTDVLKHIHKQTLCTKENTILLLMDNHLSHCSLESIIFAKENGIVLLTFPPHCSHKLQPLDVAIYSSFKNSLKISFNNFMASNPAKKITIYDIPNLSKVAYESSFTYRNIISSFEKPGLWPINSQIFSESDFDAAFVTDREFFDSQENTLKENLPATSNIVLPATFNPVTNMDILENQDNFNSENVLSPSTSINVLPLTSLEIIRPYPKAPPRKSINKRAKGKSTIFTDTPEKNRIAELRAAKIKNDRKKIINKSAKLVPQVNESSDSSECESAISFRESIDSNVFSDESLSFEGLPTLLDDENVNVGDFVLVKFDQKKNKDVFFVGQIIVASNRIDFEIKFLRNNRGCFVFPIIDDISYIPRTDIVALLPKPLELPGTVRTNSKYRFNVDFSIYNIR